MSLLDKVVYRHITLDTNKVFYIGMGTETRPFTKVKRSTYWKNIVKKHGYRVEILAKNLLFEDAIELEEFLISLYGRLDIKTGCLCNMTDGGEGTKNVSPEVRKKISEYQIKYPSAKKGIIFSEEHKKNISESKKGKESVFKGKKHSEKSKELIKEKRKLQIFTKETRIKKSNSVSGAKNPFAKKVINIETNEIFYTVKEAAKSINIARTYLSSMLSGKNKNTTKIIYYESIK
jgi:hypothetical protein